MKNMFRNLVALLAAVALLCSVAALAETEAPQKGLEYESTWMADAYKMDIVAEEEGFRVMVTVMSGAFEDTRWEYSCLYNADTFNLVAVSGIKTVITKDEQGQDAGFQTVYEQFPVDASFTLGQDGTLVWQDGVEDAGKGLAFRKIGSFEGTWVADRAEMEIIWDPDYTYVVNIHWASSAWESNDWSLRGDYEAETNALSAYGMESVTVYNDAGEVVSVTDVDEEGTQATFILNGDGTLLWQEKDLVFEYDLLGGTEG